MVRSLAAVMRESDVTELDLEFGPVTLRLRREGNGGFEDPPVSPPVDGSVLVPPAVPEHVITAPMIGTFYAAATPGSPPFIAVGDEVSTGQTIGIIEAMKIMNEIAADRSGVVAEILAANAQPVEYGSPLVRLNLGAGERS